MARGTATRPTASKATKGKESKKGGAAVFVGVAAAGGLLAWWLLGKRRGGTGLPRPANPIVNVGPDQAVTLDATSHAIVAIPFSVVADHAVNLAWTRTSGPGPVNFSPMGPNQELVGFTVPGNYLLRLTATDATDSRARGFDELVVTVNPAPMTAILVTGQLKVDGFATYVLTKAQGEAISFVWPVTNVGNLAGAAFIRLTEGGVGVGTGAAFSIDPGLTVNTSFNPVVSLPSGVHILIASVVQGLPPNGVAVGSPQTITLTVVSVPNLAAVGLPTIDGVLGPTQILRSRFLSSPVPVLWPCQNSGGGSGLARLRTVASDPGVSLNVTGGLVPIPGFTTLSLLLGLGVGRVGAFTPYTITLTMETDTNMVLGAFQFIITFVD